MKNNRYNIVNDNQIFRLINNDHWLLVTPCYKGVDKYMSIDEMSFLEKINSAKNISVRNALTEINKQYRNFSDTWIHDDVKYMVKNNSIDDEWVNMPKHKFRNNILNYYICSFRGKIYWTCFNANYYPQMQIMPFIDIDTEPKWENEQWTKVVNLKPIYYKDKNEIWKIL